VYVRKLVLNGADWATKDDFYDAFFSAVGALPPWGGHRDWTGLFDGDNEATLSPETAGLAESLATTEVFSTATRLGGTTHSDDHDQTRHEGPLQLPVLEGLG
jgi:hypothetical protein